MSLKKKIVLPSRGVLKQAKLRVAFHEAGRFIVTKHLRIAKVSGLHPIADGPLFAGKTLYSPTSPFNEAVIGWSGALAEMVFVIKSAKWSSTCKTVWEMFAENQLSKNDSDLITRHEEKRKTFNAAVKIIEDNFGTLKQAALELVRFNSLRNHSRQMIIDYPGTDSN
jgi:hypothetical protein